MPKKRYTPEEIIQHLRTVELDIGHGLAVLDSCRTLGITEQTDDRGKQESGGLRVDHATRLKGLEQENLRLTRRPRDRYWSSPSSSCPSPWHHSRYCQTCRSRY